MPLSTSEANREPTAPVDHHTLERALECPHCGELFKVDISCKIESARKLGDHEIQKLPSKHEQWRATLNASQISLLEMANSNGVMGSFVIACERSSHNGLPKNFEKLFLAWCSLAKARSVPAWAKKQFVELYPEAKEIIFCAHQYVGCVVVNGKLELFVPLVLVRDGVRIESDAGKTFEVSNDGEGLRQWVRGRFGYVPADSKLAVTEMKKRSIGEFANPVL